ncbi:MAG: hypothetical protein OXD32_08870, partial [Endozoicomonadaceae bacterium]|nr:hypothetical protein [Endozoicomonadaceae bacterium]
TKTQTYDDSGRSIRIYLPNGKTIINQYDDAHRCFISYQQSISGRRSAVSVTHANVLYKPTEQWLIPVSHNALLYARELCSHNPDKIIIRKVKKSVITYDGFGRIKTTTDPLEHIVKREYDTLGKLINITGPTGNKVHNVYDLAGNIIQHWAQPVYGGAYLLTSAEYNAAGELLWRAGEDGLHTTFTYTEDGKLSATTTPHGHKISLQYNNHGLPVAQLLDGKIQLQVNYDSVTSQVTTKTDNTGKTFFTYSDDGLLLYLKHTGKNGSLDYKLQWKYDHNRRVVSVTDIGANQTQTLYDSLGRVSEIRYLPDHGTPTTLSAPAYDDFSRIVTIRYGSGMHRKIIYNSFGHPQNISDKLNSTLLSKWSFDYDFNDNITTQIYQATNNQQATLNYKYDALNNLISMTCTGSAKLPLCPRDTAFAGTGLQEAPVITRQDYDFTPLNRISRVHEYLQNSIQNQSLKKTTHYYYADTSVPLRLQRISTVWNNQSLLTKNFNYDIAGNMVADGEGNHIIYNAFNQITQVTQPNGQQSNYSYDGSGREIYNKSYLGVSYLFYRGDHLINEKISDREGTSHLIGYQGIAKTIDGMIYQYNENNYRGDVVNILTKDSKNNQYKQNHRNLYSPYGMCWRADKNSLPLYKQTIRGFNGERTDPATGWQFLGAGHRTYNPQQRYFVSEDPVTGGYSFAGNNPVMNSDPSGNMPEWLGSIFKWGSYISSFGLNALHAKWAHIAGAVITSGLTVATLGGLAYTFGGALLGSVVTAGATIAGSIPVVAAAIPANKGLDIAASVTGMTMMASMAATAAIDIGLFFFAEKMIALPEGLELKWLPFNMLKGDCSANKVELFDVRKFIKRLMPDTVKTYFGNSYLYIDSMEELFTLWKHLYSKSKLIQCDSAVIFVVA